MISGEWNSFVGWVMPAFYLAAIGVIVWIIWRSGRRRMQNVPVWGASLPSCTPRATQAACVAEAAALGGLGVVIFALTATNPSTNGLLLRLHELSPRSAAVNVAVAVAAFAALLVAVLLAWRGRGGVAVWMMAGVLAAYGLSLNGPGDLIRTMAREGRVSGPIAYTIDVGGTNARGADLWVNDVYLGKTPVDTTLEEFHRKVPYWPEAPEDGSDVLEVQSHGVFGAGASHHKRWIRLTVPRFAEGYEPREAALTEAVARQSDRHSSKYFAQVKLNGRWGYGTGSAGAGGSGGGHRYRAESHIGVIFPHRDQRLESLLDKARLDDYRVGSEWFQAIETYEEDGWVAIRQVLQPEPRTQALLDSWVTWHYDLEQVSDEHSAWSAFARILDEAEEGRQYVTCGLAGRAVELLVPRLDPARLVSLAEKRIRRTRHYGWGAIRMNGRLQFGVRYRDESFSLGVALGRRNRRVTLTSAGSGRGRRSGPSDLAVAHAVWMLDQHLDVLDDSQANLVENRITPALICWHNDMWNGLALRLALHLGGSEIERFLLRHAVRADLRSKEWDDRMHFRGEQVHRWLYLAACVPGPMGQRFRRQHKEQLIEVCDQLIGHQGWDVPDRLPEFLFADLDGGEQNLAAQYWPRFRRLTRQEPDGALVPQWKYLVRVEPAATVSMYLDAWHEFQGRFHSLDDALRELAPLPLRKQQAIVSALRSEIEQDVSQFAEEVSSYGEQWVKDRLMEMLNVSTAGNRDEAGIKWIVNRLRDDALNEERRHAFRGWHRKR